MILRVGVVIAARNHARTLSQVLRDVVLRCPFPILLIDDGSETPLSYSLYSFEVRQAIESRRLRVVRFETPRGLTAAWMYGMQDLVAQGFTHMLTLNANGSNLGSDIAILIERMCECPWDVIEGTSNRDVDAGFSLGFRVLPLHGVQGFHLFGRQFLFNAQLRVRLAAAGLLVQSVPVTNQYVGVERNAKARLRRFGRMLLRPLVGGVVYGLQAVVRLHAIWIAQTPTLRSWGTQSFKQLVTFSVHFQHLARRRELNFLLGALLCVGSRSARRGALEFMRVSQPKIGLRARLWESFLHLCESVALAREASALLKKSGSEDFFYHMDGPDPGASVQLVSARAGGWRLNSLVFDHAVIFGDELTSVSSSASASGLASAHGSASAPQILPFMGRLAVFDTQVFHKAVQEKVSLAFTFGFRGDSDYEFFVRSARSYSYRPEIPAELQDFEWVTRFARQLEYFVRRYPRQWDNLLPFWSRRPSSARGKMSTVLFEDLQPMIVLRPQELDGQNSLPPWQ